MTASGIVSAFYGVGLVKKLSSASLVRLISVLLSAWFISACSGHGFKHAPALGEAVAEQIVAGQSHLDLSHFLLNRLPIRPNPAGAVL